MRFLPTPKQLRYLVAVAEHRHFGRAAAACFVTQSTLSAGLQELEDQLGVRLVERNRRRVLLTPLGEQVTGQARAALDSLEALAETARRARAPLSGPLRLGVIPTVSPFLLPRVLPALQARFPDLALSVVEDLSPRLVERLAAGGIDGALLALPWACGDSVETMALFEDPLRLACLPDHPLAAAEPLRTADLAGHPMVLLADGHCLRDQAIAACAAAGHRTAGPFEAASLHTLVQMTDNGHGITLLPDLALEHGVLAGTRLVARSFADASPARTVALAWRKASGRADEFQALGEALKAA